MLRWVFLLALVAAVSAPAAHAASPYGKAALVRCDRDGHEAVFEARMAAIRRTARMQVRFRLQVSTPDERGWRRIDAAGFGTWITAPPALARYTYAKTVQQLIVPAAYRAVIDFRWRDRRNRTLRTARATSPVCRQPDSRPDLVVRSVRAVGDTYVALIFNRGREASGPFAVDFLADGAPLGSVDVVGAAPGASVTARLQGPPCVPGTLLEAVADTRAQVEEAD
jgi:hypothetical protein